MVSGQAASIPAIEIGGGRGLARGCGAVRVADAAQHLAHRGPTSLHQAILLGVTQRGLRM